MKEQLAALYALQQLDSALAALQRQYAALDQGQAEQAVATAAHSAQQEAEATLHAVSGSLHDAELEQKTIEGKIQEFETKLYSGSIRAPKELQAMQDEIEMLKRQRARLDEKILTLMDEIEVVRLKDSETKKAQASAKSALSKKQIAYKEAAGTLVAQARVLTQQRSEAAAQIQPALLKRYESLRASKGGLAIVAIEDSNACGGCKLGLPSRLVESARQGASIEVCDNCGRILFGGE